MPLFLPGPGPLIDNGPTPLIIPEPVAAAPRANLLAALGAG